MKAKLTFYGGVGMVTGSNFLLEIDGKKVLVDCGFFQGCNTCDLKTFSSFPYDPQAIDFVFVTHAHVDHTGRIPKLVRDGFRGKIISTPPTKDIAAIMYEDSLDFLKEEAGKGGYEPLYGEAEIKKAFLQWDTVSYHEPFSISDSVKMMFKDAGHILGSAMVEFQGPEGKLVFTGDLGNSPSPLLQDAEAVTDAKYLVVESVYGNTSHEQREDRLVKFEDAIERVVKSKGALMIPAFSVERTQELLLEIKRMLLEYQIPLIPVYLDSPLAIKITEVYKKYEMVGGYYNEHALESTRKGEGLFTFPQLHFVVGSKESRALHSIPNPKIIIAGSGMSNGGRILFHEKNYLSDPASMILFVGYQSPGSLGREIQDGAKQVVIFEETVPVRAQVQIIKGYSGHRDKDGLLEFVAQSADTLKKTFVVMGEPKSSAFLTQRLRDYIGVDAVMPKEGESALLDL